MTVKITADRLKEVWNLPGCNFIRDNREGGYCALGKLELLVDQKFPTLRRSWEIANLNNLGVAGVDEPPCQTLINEHQYDSTTANYGPHNQREWTKHERAFKLALQLAQEHGLIEIEDEAAKEFGLIKEPVADGIV